MASLPTEIVVKIRAHLHTTATADWVLVKGSHDSGTIDGVFGPYSEARAGWLLANMLDTSYSNWTKIELSGLADCCSAPPSEHPVIRAIRERLDESDEVLSAAWLRKVIAEHGG